MGALLLVLILEACRRTTGWALPIVCGLFLAYGYYGGLLPQGWAIAHAGLDFDQIIDALYNSGSGFFGTPLDVAATYIVLFTIYGAVLDLSGGAQGSSSTCRWPRSGARAARPGAPRWRRAFCSARCRVRAPRPRSASARSPGRSCGRPATPRSVPAACWPPRASARCCRRPTLGAAAFIVAEYLEVSYLTVLGWAMIPTLLYYLGILLAVEIDARRFGMRAAHLDAAALRGSCSAASVITSPR